MTLYAVRLPATTDAGSVASTSFMDALPNFTVGLWVKAPSMTAFGNLLSKRSTSGGGNGWVVFPNTTGGLLSQQEDGAYREDMTNHAVADGAWHNVVIAVSSAVVTKFYVDGVLATSTTVAGTPQAPTTNATTVHVGTDGGSLSMTNLLYANLKAWNTTLGLSDAVALAAGGDVPAGQIANWNFTEGTGLTATDTIASRVLTFTSVVWSGDIPSALTPAAVTIPGEMSTSFARRNVMTGY